jgi:hypothetical protein
LTLSSILPANALPPGVQEFLNNCAARGCADGLYRFGEKTFKIYRTGYSQYRAYEFNQFNDRAQQLEHQRRQQQMQEYCARNGCHYR